MQGKYNGDINGLFLYGTIGERQVDKNYKKKKKKMKKK